MENEEINLEPVLVKDETSDEVIDPTLPEEEPPAPKPGWYVSYDPVTFELTGYYWQLLHPSHVDNHIWLGDEGLDNWLAYRLNADHTGLERIPPAPPAPPTVEQYTEAVQVHLHERARTLGYDNILTAVTYADEPAVPKFQMEGQALRRWRSLVWQHCQTLMAQVVAGEAPAPTIDDLVAGLPAFVPPVDEPEEPAP